LPQIDHLFIAEKPSLAEGIAKARAEQLGVSADKRSSEACWVVGPDRVTWLYGHMYDTAEPGTYGEQWKTRSISALPIVVPHDKWQLVIAEDRAPAPGDNRTPLDKRAHLKLIGSLMKSASRLVNCGDAAREGQLLVDECIIEAGFDAFAPNVLRLWVKSLARKDLLAALAGMKPNAEKRTLYEAAVCRQRADWLHGMNYSRLYTGLAKQSGADASIQVGRVMTPTLRLVVDRDRERMNFKEVRHYLPRVKFRHDNGTFAANWVIPDNADGLDAEGRLVDKSVAERICAKVDGKPGRIAAYKTEQKSKGAPLPFSLSALQAECSAKLHLTADETLTVAQALYEKHKATTYPRSDSRHLPTAILKDEAPGIMAALARTEEYGEVASKADMGLRSAAWDDSKVSDHHGIIPTSEFSASKLAQMDDVERKVFRIIAQTFIAQFHPNFKWKATSVEVSCESEKFRASGRLITDQGWKVVYGAGEADDDEDKDDESAQSVPAMSQGDQVVAQGGDVTVKNVPKPPEFNDGTLITAMVNAHRFETNPELKKRLRDGDGIGTEATRAATIQKLLGVNKAGKVLAKNPLLSRKGKNGLVSTDFGRSVIDMLPEDLRSLGMTALWEGMLSNVDKGTLQTEEFLDRQAKNISERIEAAKGSKVTIKGVKSGVRPIEGDGDTCPKCREGIQRTREIPSGEHKGKKYLSCSRYPDCDHRVFPQTGVEPLPGHRKPCLVCNKGEMWTREITSKKTGQKYRLLACSNRPDCKNEEWPQRATVEPLPGDGKACPKCASPMKTFMVQKEGPNKGKRFLGCTNRDCKTFEFPEPDIAPIPGHGEPCAKCGKGTMKTKQINAKSGKTYIVLACTNYPECTNTVFGDRPSVEPLPGDGKACPDCKTGTLRTKGYKDKKDGSEKRMLSCTAYPECKHAEWPDSGPSEGGKSGGKAASGKGGSGRR
jgi:DNA topoisomerase-3